MNNAVKKLIKVAVCIFSFCAALFIISLIYNRGNTDMTADMQPASYPIIYMEMNSHRVNCLHAYTKEMDLTYMRDSITPLVEGRGVSIDIDTFGRKLSSIVYEIRDISGERLVEQTQLLNYVQRNEHISATFSVKNLIEEEQEYNLIFLLTMENGDVIRYYTRIIQAYDYKAEEKLDFIFDFSDKTFSTEDVAQELVTYLESDASGDNSSYRSVDIHSSFEQITWGDLNISRVSTPVATISEISGQTACVELNYRVSLKEGKKETLYQVCESFRVRTGTERMYLLAYNRTMNRLMFDAENLVFGNTMMLGIVDENMQYVESSDGKNFAFVNEGSLYSYGVVSNNFANVFSFYDEEEIDDRTLYNNHEIKILNIDENGNIYFLVYGYMNRGRYEGQVAATLYFYDAVVNDTQEMFTIKYNKSAALLKANVNVLSYLNREQIFYIYLDQTIYSVDLKKNHKEIVVGQLTEQTLKVSEDNSMLAWQVGDNPNDSKELTLMNLNSTEQTAVNARSDSRLKPLGFMGNDLFYGLAKTEDIYSDVGGAVVFPMYNVRIRSNNGDILKNYEQEGYYVTNCVIQDGIISMNRMCKNEDGLFEETTGDTILNNKLIQPGRNRIETVVTQNLKKIVQIAIKTDSESAVVKELIPREVLYEGDKTILLASNDEPSYNYYVYSFGKVEGIFHEPAGAVNLAYDISGVVIGEDGKYIWIKGNRSTKNQIMAIEAEKMSETRGTLGVCLDTMLSYAGITRSSQSLVDRGQEANTILRTSMPDATVLDLTGCSLDAILYYVNRDIPVLVQMDNRSAMLVIGFNEMNTVVMDPELGTIYKIGKNDSQELFEQNGNRFLTYIPDTP